MYSDSDTPLRVLVACEYSGRVREAFRRRGHEAWSCDLLESEDNSPFHLQEDVLGILDHGWDLMIAHPPCTYLANSSAKHLYIGGRKENGRDPERWAHLEEGAEFYRKLRDANQIKRRCVENPRMLGYARRQIGGVHTQVVQPWQFGHGETKATCLELINLPLLKPTNIVPGREPKVHKMSPGPNRWKERSRTYGGIAEAMADQWSSFAA